jgi:hypothetical protein
MNYEKLKLALIVAAVLISGCSTKADYRKAIERALTYDDAIANTRSDEAGLWGILFGDDKARRQYVARLRKIPLDGCPSEFVTAYNAHIAAWEANDSEGISRTWDQVIFVAYDYGVAEQ